MGKSDVTLKFDAETAAFVTKIMKARQELEATGESARKLGDHAESGGERASEAIEKFGHAAGKTGTEVGELVHKVTEFTTVAGAAGGTLAMAFGTVDTLLEREEKKATALLDRIKQIDSALAASGQNEQSPQVHRIVEGMAGQEFGGERFSAQQIGDTFSAISRGVGNKIGVGEKLHATEVSLLEMAAGADQQTANQAGIFFAQLARERRPGGKLEHATNEQLSTLATQLTEGGVEASEQNLQFLMRGGDLRQSAKLLLSAAQTSERTKGLHTIQALADREFDPTDMRKIELETLRHPGPTNPKAPPEEQRIELALSKIPAGPQRLAAMLENPQKFVPAADRETVQQLAEGAKRIPEAVPLRQRIERLRATEDTESKLRRQAQNFAADELEARRQEEIEALAVENRKRKIRADLEKNHEVMSAIPLFSRGEAFFQVELGAAPTFDDAVDPEAGELPKQVQFGPMPKQVTQEEWRQRQEVKEKREKREAARAGAEGEDRTSAHDEGRSTNQVTHDEQHIKLQSPLQVDLTPARSAAHPPPAAGSAPPLELKPSPPPAMGKTVGQGGYSAQQHSEILQKHDELIDAITGLTKSPQPANVTPNTPTTQPTDHLLKELRGLRSDLRSGNAMLNRDVEGQR